MLRVCACFIFSSEYFTLHVSFEIYFSTDGESLMIGRRNKMFCSEVLYFLSKKLHNNKNSCVTSVWNPYSVCMAQNSDQQKQEKKVEKKIFLKQNCIFVCNFCSQYVVIIHDFTLTLRCFGEKKEQKKIFHLIIFIIFFL